MKQSQLFTKTLKQTPSDEQSYNARALIQGGFINKEMAGVYDFLPLGLRVLNKIIAIIREEINAVGGQETFLASLQNPELWKKTNRWDDAIYDVWFKTKLKNDTELGLATTHEEPLTNLLRKHISSYKDLPKSIYHFQTKFRNETRAKSGLMRLREFIMKDAYSFHASEEDLDAYYEKMKAAYTNIFKRAGLGDLTYLTFASGGTFSKYSHEFQTLTSAGEDIIYICEKCRVALNREIIEDVNHKCTECGNDKLREEKAVEVGNIFKLKTKYSSPLGLAFMDEEGVSKDVVMGCYGIGPQRLMGTVVETLHDEKGIIWPEAIAPFKVHILSLNKGTEAEKIYADLSSAGIEVLFDDRELTAGEKFADADLIGIPYRVVVSEKSLAAGGVEVKKRSEKEGDIEKVENLLKLFLKN
ncbi:MAG: aminoacyl--tRNA ligase-related protein [Patescibacteria group bacterium]|jgi:prolyl-tRNA synthetase